MEYTQEEQYLAIKTLSDLVNENQTIKGQLQKAQEFAIRLLLSQSVVFNDNSIEFVDNGVIDYGEDWEKILSYFFLDFYPNSNANIIDGIYYKSSFSVRIKDGTHWPLTGNIDQIRAKISELNERFTA